MSSITKTISVGKKGMVIIDTIKKEEFSYLAYFKLNKTELAELDKLNKKRRLEWFAVRYAIKSHTVGDSFIISHDKNGKPFFKNNLENKLSISHSGNKVVVYIANQECGVDIQYYTDKTSKVKEKFISEKENNFLTKEDNFKQLHIIWSAKESLYKLYGKGGLDFKNDIIIDPFVPNGITFMIKGHLIIDGSITSYNLGVELLEEEVLVWTID